MKKGWKTAISHFYLVIVLFLYQLIWGFFLYRFVENIVVPLLQRYPDTIPSEAAKQLFLLEAQFRLLKTDLIQPYLWTLGGLFAARMLISPLINAGLFYSLYYATDEGGTKFFEGIRKVWKPVALAYWLETACLFAPSLLFLPLSSQSVFTLLNGGDWIAWLPFAAGWLVWGIAVHLLFLGLQFGIATGQGVWPSLRGSVRRLLPLTALSLLMWGIGCGIGLASASISLIWAGLFALLLHQAFYLARTFIKVWTIAAQYAVWLSKPKG
jgi:hypothetical protein